MVFLEVDRSTKQNHNLYQIEKNGQDWILSERMEKGIESGLSVLWSPFLRKTGFKSGQ